MSWEAAEIERLRQVLAPAGDPAGSLPDEILSQAQRDLEHLGTRDAVELMFALTRKDPSRMPTFGLLRAPDRAFVIKQMDSFLEDHETAFDRWSLGFRALLEFTRRHPTPWAPTNQAAARAFRAGAAKEEADRRRKEFEEITHDLAVRLIPRMEDKARGVRKQCADVLIEVAPAEAKASGLVEAYDYALSREQLIAGFSGFTQERQLALMSQKWALVRGPDVAFTLRTIVENAKPDDTLPVPDADVSWTGPTSLGAYALYRLREIAPIEEKQFLLDDIAQETPRFVAAAVRELPVQEHAQADRAIGLKLRRLRQGPLTLPDLAGIALAAKFGSKRLEEPMKELFPELGSCMMQPWFLAYFLRVDPEEGARRLDRGMNARDENCFESTVGSLAAIARNNQVQSLALKMLNDSDGGAAANSAIALAQFGDAEVEAALCSRLQRWSKA